VSNVKNKLVPWKRKNELQRLDEGFGLNPFSQLRNQIDELFEEAFDSFPSFGRWPALGRLGSDMKMVSPDFEVTSTEDEIQVKAELPGMTENDIEVTVDENSVTISGNKKEEKEEKKRDCYFSEVRYGHFSRTIPLPAGIDREKAKAQFKRGVLKLTLPRTEKAKTERKQIKIESE